MIYILCFILCAIIGFQVALILGAPWGRITQGGQNEGALPLMGRIIAGVSIVILSLVALAMLSAEGHWPYWPLWTAWFAIAVLALSTLLNWITPSPAERRLWGPTMTITLMIAISVLF